MEYDGQPGKLGAVTAMKTLAKTIFDQHVDRPGQSYASLYPDLAAVWPSNDTNVADKQFYAMAWLLPHYPNNKPYKNILNYYFSYAEESHDWRPCTVDIDNFFVAANQVMSHFETFDPRYRLHVERCVAAWTGQKVQIPFVIASCACLLPCSVCCNNAC